ncbi:MAG: site-specific DNA-methyltransferase [Deltaproteobacteria bacterium]|nr:site-specific DNA-methyltransferase [Deltaproteobacteria bacterium]
MLQNNLGLSKEADIHPLDIKGELLLKDLESFREFGTGTQMETITGAGLKPVPVFINEFWTSKQRAAHSLHEVSYRACFKPQLPRFFIERLTGQEDLVYDPFMGRGTTLLEGALLGRNVAGCDINPLSKLLVSPRLNPPDLIEIEGRLKVINFEWDKESREDLLVFYHPDTLKQICALRNYFIKKKKKTDIVDSWIRMVATSRLTGHSKGFFSVYTLPPNQAVTIERQRIINEQRKQKPEKRDVPALIFRKSKSLLSKLKVNEINILKKYSSKALLLTQSCDKTRKIKSNSVSLVVTSPPFLDTVDYAADNWLRCWFNGINEKDIPIWILKKVEDWKKRMTSVFKELRRILLPGGYVAFEVGEVRSGRLKLEEQVIPAAEAAGLTPILVLINSQKFTKTSNCWGVNNLSKGTNTNRVVLLKKRP